MGGNINREPSTGKRFRFPAGSESPVSYIVGTPLKVNEKHRQKTT